MLIPPGAKGISKASDRTINPKYDFSVNFEQIYASRGIINEGL
jgi:hypothetical protein